MKALLVIGGNTMENKDTLTNAEKKLIDELKRRKMERDNLLGIAISLSKENKTEKMLEWLLKHPEADNDRIDSKWCKMMGIVEPDFD